MKRLRWEYHVALARACELLATVLYNLSSFFDEASCQHLEPVTVDLRNRLGVRD